MQGTAEWANINKLLHLSSLWVERVKQRVRTKPPTKEMGRNRSRCLWRSWGGGWREAVAPCGSLDEVVFSRGHGDDAGSLVQLKYTKTRLWYEVWCEVRDQVRWVQVITESLKKFGGDELQGDKASFQGKMTKDLSRLDSANQRWNF